MYSCTCMDFFVNVLLHLLWILTSREMVSNFGIIQFIRVNQGQGKPNFYVLQNPFIRIVPEVFLPSPNLQAGFNRDSGIFLIGLTCISDNVGNIQQGINQIQFNWFSIRTYTIKISLHLSQITNLFIRIIEVPGLRLTCVGIFNLYTR